MSKLDQVRSEMAAENAAWRDRMSAIIDEIELERERQHDVEGWTAQHDDQHDDGSLAAAGGTYALHAAMPDEGRAIFNGIPFTWPPSWNYEWWKPKDRRRDLVRAAALIVAEIERLDRLAEKGGAS